MAQRLMASAEGRFTPERASRAGGALLLAGALAMVAGAGIFLATGADLDSALVSGELAAYLSVAAESRSLLTVNLLLWTSGVLLIGMGGNLLASHRGGDSASAAVARFCFTVAPAAAVVFFSIWLGIVLELAPSYASGADVLPLAAALGQAATIADWISTSLIVGVGAFALAAAGRETWVPIWLYRWGQIALLTAAVSLATVAFADRAPPAFLIIPVGLGFMLAAAVVSLRRA